MVRSPGARASGPSSSSIAEGYSLTGPSRALDPRVNAWRSDLADIALAGRVIAPHYASPLMRACGAHATTILPSPDEAAEPLSELLPGEGFAVLEYAGGWAWGQCDGDNLVGYVDAVALTEPRAATHVVAEKCAPISGDSLLTSPVLAWLPMGSRLHGHEEGACLCTEYGCVPLSHLRAIGEAEEDPVLVAERLLGSVWEAGGRSPAGIDGAGLVQLALSLCGIAVPRLAALQGELGAPLRAGEKKRRADIVLAEGDAGLMIDDAMMIHACPAAKKVKVSALAAAEPGSFEVRRLS